ncbi:unnamed protein product [Brachionus calyciflorus]|uniref:Uncharacterized protein n=1 Tax=Brachionus calyciflorus TaxID=104777 RepID=A0A814F6C2_9BILA|nr:unnamed protein product [Brachionus calyciflorus]
MFGSLDVVSFIASRIELINSLIISFALQKICIFHLEFSVLPVNEIFTIFKIDFDRKMVICVHLVFETV